MLIINIYPVFHFPLKTWYSYFMLIALAIISIIFLGIIIKFSFSSTSTSLIKRISLIALILIGLAVGICSIILIIGPSEDQEGVAFPVFQEARAAPAEKSNIVAIIIFLIIFVIFPILIIFLARRNKEQKRRPKEKPRKTPIFHVGNDLDDPEETGKSDKNEDNDDFHFEIK